MELYDLEHIDSSLVTEDMIRYSARKTCHNDFVEIFKYEQRNRYIINPVCDLSMSLGNVFRIKKERELNREKHPQGIHGPIDALLFDW